MTSRASSCVTRPTPPPPPAPPLQAAGPGSASAGAAPTAPASAAAAARATACILYGVGNQVVGTTIFLEAREATQRAWAAPAAAAFAAILALYAAAALAGAAAFGRAVLGDVLLDFGARDAAAGAAKALMALHVALVLPVDIVPLRRSLAVAARAACRARAARAAATARGGGAARGDETDAALLGARGEGEGEGEGPKGRGEGQEPTHRESTSRAHTRISASTSHCAARPPPLRSLTRPPPPALPGPTAGGRDDDFDVDGAACSLANAAQSAAVVFIPAFVAVFFPQLNVFFGLFGATLGVSGTYLFPALFLLRKARALEAGEWPRDEGADGFAPAASAASPACARAQGAALLGLSALSAALGTGVFFYDLVA
jgi:hypothetical protein